MKKKVNEMVKSREWDGTVKSTKCKGCESFGTDSPVFTAVVSTRDWIQLLMDLPVNAPRGTRFTENEVEAILGGNTASILGL
jgi:hypothetical protein